MENGVTGLFLVFILMIVILICGAVIGAVNSAREDEAEKWEIKLNNLEAIHQKELERQQEAFKQAKEDEKKAQIAWRHANPPRLVTETEAETNRPAVRKYGRMAR